MQPVQMKMARAALDLSVERLATAVGVAPDDIARMETATDATGDMTARVRGYFESAGVVLVGQDGVRFTGAANDGTVPLDQLNSANDE